MALLTEQFPPWQTMFYHFRRFRPQGRWTVLFTALHDAERQRLGRDPHPSAAIMDTQSVKTVEESARISGFDAHTRVKGREAPISWLILQESHCHTMSPRLICMTRKAHGDFLPAYSIVSPRSRSSGRTVRTAARTWAGGAKQWVTGISKSSTVHPARTDSPYDRKDRSLNELSAGSRAIGE